MRRIVWLTAERVVGRGPEVPLLRDDGEHRDGIEVKLHWLAGLSSLVRKHRIITTMPRAYPFGFEDVIKG
jgi:hypothetical protein